MKQCPTCKRSYTDESLSFCLDDGSPLATVAAQSAFDPNATISYSDAPQTSGGEPPPTIAFGSYSGAPTGPPTSGVNQFTPPAPPVSQQHQPPPSQPFQQQWSPAPSFSAPAPKKRSALPWVIGIVALLLVVGGAIVIGVIGLAAWGANTNTANTNNTNNANGGAKNTNRNTNGGTSVNGNNSNNVNRNTNSGTGASTVRVSDDFSAQKWGTGNYPFGSLWYQNGEYHMRAVKDGYLVMYAPSGDYGTENATVRVTARNVDGVSPLKGYGLVVHGEKTKDKGELEDYAFLIYTGDNQQFTIIMHKGGAQTTVVPWTRSNVLRTGTSPNQLEVRVKEKQISFYINGQYVTTIADSANFSRGVAGFYTSDVSEVAFDDLEINR
ncbi:MAG TPA: hypothetical protein VF507_10670 [Pyrinomonadaceae bacterium]|jgi:hypothetical protein